MRYAAPERSATDPICVIDILKSARAPKICEIVIAGEVLVNDGIGVVLFTLILVCADNGVTLPVHSPRCDIQSCLLAATLTASTVLLETMTVN
jgi:sodium/hydrogen exchanger family protein